MQHDAIKVHEREWEDEFGITYKAWAVSRSGKLYSQTVMKHPHLGWPRVRSQAAENVRISAERDEVYNAT
jgi:hypothetical protein